MNDKNNKLNDLREEDPKLFDELMDARDAYSRYEVYSKIDDRKAWEKFRTRYFAPETSRHANPVLRYLLMAAAVACLLIVGTVVLFHNDSPSGDKGQVALSSRQQRQSQQGQVRRVNASGMHASSGTASIPSAIAPMPLAFFESAGSEAEGSGQVVTNDKVVHLEDGTTVWLNSGATLKYPQHFEAGNRTVYLEGEAYFQVHSEADRPFYVRTASGIVREYGTSFNVDAMTSRTIVTLVEGSISVYANGGAEQNIRPGEQAIMTASSQVAQIYKIDVTNTIA